MSPALVAWVEALLASLWQAPLLAAVAWLVEQGFCVHAGARHAVRMAALLTTPVMPMATWIGWLPGLGELVAASLAPGMPPSGFPLALGR